MKRNISSVHPDTKLIPALPIYHAGCRLLPCLHYFDLLQPSPVCLPGGESPSTATCRPSHDLTLCSIHTATSPSSDNFYESQRTRPHQNSVSTTVVTSQRRASRRGYERYALHGSVMAACADRPPINLSSLNKR